MCNWVEGADTQQASFDRKEWTSDLGPFKDEATWKPDGRMHVIERVQETGYDKPVALCGGCDQNKGTAGREEVGIQE